MRQRQLSDGRVSLQVSQLCLGTMNFGYRTDERTSFAILDRFLEGAATSLTRPTTTASGTATPARANGSSGAGDGRGA
jgi:hypothetical protein